MYYEAAKNIGFAIACHAVGADKEAIMYSVIAVICIVGACAEYGMAEEIAVTGRKGTVDIKVSNEGDIPNQIGVSEFIKWLNAVKEQAQSQGFKELQIIVQRVEHSTSANPGHVVNKIIKLER